MSTIDWSKMLTRGEGVKNPEILADVICERPLSMNLHSRHYVILDMNANTGLGCLKGFEWNSTKPTCQPICEPGDIPRQNAGNTLLSDEDACRKYCKTLSGAKFAVFELGRKICWCKSGDTGKFQSPCCLLCPL